VALPENNAGPGLKQLTARSVKWNLIDKVSQQALYLITGVVLANLLTQDDFGLVGAVLVFQAFASLLVDSGFSYALLQRKNPTRTDYSTVLWFNLAVAAVLYVVLFFCAPLIAGVFQHDERLVPLSRVMFLSFILNASAIVQTNRFMKEMNVRPVAAANSLGLFAGAVAGIWLAVSGAGAWAIVWQTITLAAVKSLTLWLSSGWRPEWRFSMASLRGFFAVGSWMMATSFLNTVFQNIYSFFIGYRAGLAPLGYYTQADKWSKMGITTISQTLTSAFLPTLSQVQDDCERFARVSAKMNRSTSYLLFPCMGFLLVMATPLFHALFGEKWDFSIPLFQILLLRGVFTVLTAGYNNFAIARARTRLVFRMELLRDGAALLFLAVTYPWIADSYETDLVWGIKILLWGQLLASGLTWLAMLRATAPVARRPMLSLLADSLPYLLLTLVCMAPMWGITLAVANPWLQLLLQGVCGAVIYIGACRLSGSAIQRDLLQYLRGKNSSSGKS